MDQPVLSLRDVDSSSSSSSENDNPPSGPLALAPVIREVIDLAARQQEHIHYAAIQASPLFSVEHWKHHAGPEWPHEPDDDSYIAFENCEHPDCKLVRVCAALRVLGGAQTGDTEKEHDDQAARVDTPDG